MRMPPQSGRRNPELGEHAPVLASNLQRWRTRRSMSVSALARAAEVSKSTVSELERGMGNPSLDTLWSLAKTLNVPLGALFADHEGSEQPEVRRYEDAPVLTQVDPSHVAKLMAGWRANGEIEVAIVTLAPGARRESSGNAAGVIERAICVEGDVEVGTRDRSAVLAVGDLILIHADQPHFYHAIGGPGRLVVVQQYPPSG